MFDKQIEDAKALRRKQQGLLEERERLGDANRLKQLQVDGYNAECERRTQEEKRRIVQADADRKKAIRQSVRRAARRGARSSIDGTAVQFRTTSHAHASVVGIGILAGEFDRH